MSECKLIIQVNNTSLEMSLEVELRFFLRICWIYKSGPEKILDTKMMLERSKKPKSFFEG